MPLRDPECDELKSFTDRQWNYERGRQFGAARAA